MAMALQIPGLPPGGGHAFWQQMARRTEPELSRLSGTSASAPNRDQRLLVLKYRMAVACALAGEIRRSKDFTEQLGSFPQRDLLARGIAAYYGPWLEQPSHSPAQLSGLAFLAFSLYYQAKYSAAAQAFAAVAQLDPANEWPLNYQAISLYQAGDLDTAVQMLKTSLGLNPGNDYTHLLLGQAYLKQGHVLQGLAEMARASKAVKEWLLP